MTPASLQQAAADRGSQSDTLKCADGSDSVAQKWAASDGNRDRLVDSRTGWFPGKGFTAHDG